MTSKDYISIVVPCYNEEIVISETMKRLCNFAKKVDMSVELIFVDDGSKDKTRELIKSFDSQGIPIRLVGFSRNFGHQIAVSAGIDVAQGDAIVLIDADLQDPPEVIPEMIQKWREGFDVVYGVRTDRAGESAFKLATARGFYRLLNRLSDVPIPLDTGDFRLMSRAVADVLRAMPEKDRFLRGMVSWVGFRQTPLPYRRAPRYAGESKYPFTKMARFAIDGILSFSIKPLQISISVGLLSAFIAMLVIFYALYLRLFTHTWVEGWTAIMVAVLFIGGAQLISIGVLGEYVGRIYSQSKGRPLYVSEEYFGFGEADLERTRAQDVKRNSGWVTGSTNFSMKVPRLKCPVPTTNGILKADDA